MRSLVICCTLRSGSNLLCELLEYLGYGRPTEFFQENMYKNRESNRLDYFNTLRDFRTLYNDFSARHQDLDWRSTKWNWPQFNLFLSTSVEFPDLLFERWLPNPVWIRLRRRNRIRQAISMYIAKKTNVWVVGDVEHASEQGIEYDFDAIKREFIEFSVEDELWDSYFEKNGIPYIDISYEELVSDLNKTLRNIVEFIEPNKKKSPDCLLPPIIKNQRRSSDFYNFFEQQFLDDLSCRKHTQPSFSEQIDNAIASLNKNFKSNLFDKLINDIKGPLNIRKLNLREELQVMGPHEWIEQSHFLDGEALRLDPGGVACLDVKADRVFVEFLSHQWSGSVEIAGNDFNNLINLFSVNSSRYPWMKTFDKSSEKSVKFASSSSKHELSSGYEVWIQRIWVLIK